MKNKINNHWHCDSSPLTQKMKVFTYLKEHVATASMVTAATGVPQKCVTRYKREFEKAGILWEVTHSYCMETGYKAWYLTTNPSRVFSWEAKI